MSRFEKIAEKLEQYNLDALLVLSKAGRLYAAGFPSSAGAALITKEESYFITDSRYIEAASQKVSGAVILENTREKSIAQLVEEAVQRHGVKRLGFEEDFLTVAEFERLSSKFSCELVKASALLVQLRAVKEPWEIDQMTAAQRIAEKALTEALDFIHIGRTEKEIAAFLQYRMMLSGAEGMSFDPIVVSGANSSMPHGVPTDKMVEAGDFITMDFGCIYNGYCSDMTRTVAAGSVSEEMERVYHTVLKAQLAGIAVAKAGVAGCDIHAAGATVIEEAGYGPYFGHGFGHSLGVDIHESPGASPGYKEAIPAGAVITAEPGIYLPGKFGVRIEDMIVLRENGCENLTNAPKELIVL